MVDVLWWIGLLAGGSLVMLTGWAVWRRSSRDQLYRELAAKRPGILASHPVKVACPVDPASLATEFAEKRIVRVDDFLLPEHLARALREAEENETLIERSYVPTHKQGGTISYESIHHHAPTCLSIFHSPELMRFISRIVGAEVVPTADHDQSSCSLLCYTREGDHINWHFDHNFYQGRHFTVLLSLRNEGAEGGVSASDLMYRDADGVEHVVDTRPNSLVVFEGDYVLHKATKTKGGDVRVILSMTYCTDPRIHWFSEIIRRIKDTAFYGLRTLWD